MSIAAARKISSLDSLGIGMMMLKLEADLVKRERTDADLGIEVRGKGNLEDAVRRAQRDGRVRRVKADARALESSGAVSAKPNMMPATTVLGRAA